MLSHHLPVVRRENDHGVIALTGGFDGLYELSQEIIYKGDEAKVGGPNLPEDVVRQRSVGVPTTGALAFDGGMLILEMAVGNLRQGDVHFFRVVHLIIPLGCDERVVRAHVTDMERPRFLLARCVADVIKRRICDLSVGLDLRGIAGSAPHRDGLWFDGGRFRPVRRHRLCGGVEIKSDLLLESMQVVVPAIVDLARDCHAVSGGAQAVGPRDGILA